MNFNKLMRGVGDFPGADNELSKNNTDDEIGPSTVTPLTSFRASSERSEGSVAMGREMLRFAQHDSTVTHTDVRIILLIYIIGGGRDKSAPTAGSYTLEHKLTNFFFCAGDELQYGIPHIVNCN